MPVKAIIDRAMVIMVERSGIAKLMLRISSATPKLYI